MMKWAISNYNQRIKIHTTVLQPIHRTEDLQQAIDMGMMDGYASLDDLFWQDFVVEWGTNL